MGIREQKIESRIKHLVGDMLLRGWSDPRLDALISVTQVRVSPDLREAQVFVSVYSATPSATVMSGLQAAQQRVQRQVAHGLGRRVAPRISFHLDESLKRQGQTLALLDQVRPEANARPADPGANAPPASSSAKDTQL